MLQELRIKDFAIIDEIHLEFAAGFVVLTGETGAGKSIIIDAVELLLGGRADNTVIRGGADCALLEATFRYVADGGGVAEILEREGLLDAPGFVTLGREIRREGRNIGRVNGRSVSVSLLRELGEQLVDVHGQSEHLSLLRVREHLNLLDRYARTEHLREEFSRLHGEYSRLRGQLANLREKERDAARRMDLLAYQINEIEAAALNPGEEESLREERTRLANAEQLSTLTDQALASLVDGGQARLSASDLLGEAVDALAELSKVDPSMRQASLEGQTLLEQLGEIGRNLRLYGEKIEFNPGRLDEVEERLSLIHSLGRKYGPGIEGILAYAEHARQDLESITHAEERIDELEKEEQRLLALLGEKGQRLSEMRRQASEQLAQAIQAEMAELNMGGALFGTEMHWEDDPAGVPVGERRVSFSASGLDEMEFLVSPNPGEDLKPLAKIASGGESSRMMLGLKGVLAQADRTPTLIFDEIDQGIGGRVGGVVGGKLWRLARQHQVLCVTHLPQMAAFGDQHIKVEKLLRGHRTVTRVRTLKGKERAAELAQMLGGETEPNLASAEELLRQAKEEKSARPAA
jgi:DNA repair protein RecN (Recombination protein N)